MLFLLNKEIDMLYSLSTSSESSAQQNVGTFSMNSIRMKSNLGLAGKVSTFYKTLCNYFERLWQAYTSGKIRIESDATQASGTTLIAEEKDLAKLKVSSVKNAVAIPVLDK